MEFLKVSKINKSFGEEENRVHVLKDIDFEVDKGQFCVLLGPSGSGKSTLLNKIGGIDTADSGDIEVSGDRLSAMNDRAFTDYRRRHLGYVFQMYNLIPNLTVCEVFAVLNLKSNGQVIDLNICSMGTLYASMVSPREVFKSSILSNAAAFICLHNHPSGNPEPSDEDIKATKRLMYCGKLLDIRMLDHVIVAAESGRMFSFRNEGILDNLEDRNQEWER